MGLEEAEEGPFVDLVVDVEDDGDGFFFCEVEEREIEKGLGFEFGSGLEDMAAIGVEYGSLVKKTKGKKEERKHDTSLSCLVRHGDFRGL